MKLLGASADLDASSLLLANASPGGVEAVLAQVIEAADLHLLAWHMTDGGSRSPAISAKVRAFGTYATLAKGEAALSTTVSLGTRTIYADVRWVSSDARADLLKLVARPQSAADTVLVFFPAMDAHTAATWSRATLALLWSRLESTSPDPASQQAIAPSVILAALLERTVSLTGMLGVIVSSEDAGGMLWLVGPPPLMDRLQQRLDGRAQVEWLPTLEDLSRLWWLPVA